MSHYFTENQNVPHDRKEVSFRFLGIFVKLISDSGVFSKDHLDPGTELLLKNIHALNPSGRFADVGCGYGPIGICIKKIFDSLDVVMFDINERAVSLAVENAKRNSVEVTVKQSNGFESIEGQFDFVALNPPIRAGKTAIYSLFEQAYESTSLNGVFIIVIRKQHGALSAMRKLDELFGNCELMDRDRGYHVYKSIKIDKSTKI